MNKDYKSHNEEVREVWKGYWEGNPIRVPMILGLSERSYLSDPKLNKSHTSYKDYHNPDIMMPGMGRELMDKKFFSDGVFQIISEI